MEELATSNDYMNTLLSAAPLEDHLVPENIAQDKIDDMIRSVAMYENGLYVFIYEGFGPGKYARFSESPVHDNGAATSFRLHHFITKKRQISAADALWAATRLSRGIFAQLKTLGVQDAGAVLCMADDEPGKEQWDYRFYAGTGAGAAATDMLAAPQPVAVFRTTSKQQDHRLQ